MKSMILRIMLAIVALTILAPLQLLGQSGSCNGSTCTAASLSQTDFLAALPSPSNTNATVVVNLPAGSVGWTGNITYVIPSAVTNLTIQGATTVNCTGTAGTSGYACTATDNTNIADNWNNGTGGPLLSITTGNNASLFRMTGITWKGGTSTQSKYGLMIIAGNSWNVRIDHNHFNSLTYAATCGGQVCASTAWGRIQGSNKGVIDHNLFDLASCNGSVGGCNPIEAGFEAFNTIGDTVGNGDGTYHNPTPFGTDAFIFFESNVFNGGAPNDCAAAGTFVMRYNTLNNTYVAVQTHATKSSAGPERGCRAYEAYNNYGGTPPGPNVQASGWFGSKIGTALVYNNEMNGTAYRFFEACTDRNCGSTVETNVPNGWGYCGTTTPPQGSSTPNGVGSPWDGNQPNIANGYPCIDGLGRGQTTDVMNGANFNATTSLGRLNVTAGNIIAWPHQYLEPIYLWNNNTHGATYYSPSGDLNSQNNRDYYYDQTAQSGPFTGAAGTGFGLHSARPATCTAGPGGTYGASPTGSYGVSYFETDTNHLFVCTATNTWTNVYTPYVYPHPLVGGGTTYTLTANTTGSGTGTLGGSNCSSSTYPSGTAVTCTATPSGGSVFAGWSGGTCSGTGACSFTLTGNLTVTATFNTGATTWTLAVSTAGAGSGTVSGTNCANTTYPDLTTISCTATPSGGSSFTGWSGTGGCTGTGACTFNISANSTVIATFGNAPAAAPVWTPGSGNYASGTTGVLTTPTAGCGSFIYWQNHNPPTTADYNVQNYVINAAGTYYAKVIGCPGFADSSVTSVTYTLATFTLSTSVTGSGSLVCSPIGSGISPGTPFSCTVTPGTGYSTSTVTGCGGTWTSSPYTGTMPSSNCTVAATFTPNNYTISTATTGTGTGTITGCAGVHAYNTAFSCSITPDPGSTLGTVTGCAGSGSTVYSGLMPLGDCTVTAPFQGTVATPSFSPTPGTYGPAQSVTLSDSTSGSTIYYTLDGSTPTTGSTVYSGAITVSTTTTVKAIAAKTGYTNSAVASGTYTINGTLSAPTFSPAAGPYATTQTVTLTAAVPVVGFSGTEGSNSNASNGATPTRNAYTNCAESYSGGQLQPAGFPLGQDACTSADRTAIISAGGPTLTAVTSTITGTGTHALQNGRGAGGTDSLNTASVSYGNALAGDCGTSTNYPSALIPGLVIPGAVAGSRAVFSGITNSSNFNTSLLAPTKWSFVTGGDTPTRYVVAACETVPVTSGTGFHLEIDLNHTISTHDYFGPGLHYNFTDSKWYYCFQGCGSWAAMKEIEADGTVHTTLPLPAGHHMYYEFYYHRDSTCTSSSGSNCEFIDAMCQKDVTAGGTLTCYNLQDAGTGDPVGGIPINQPTYPPEMNLQHQLDFNQASYTGTVNSDFRNVVAFTSPTIYYTTDGSTPTTSSAVYTLPIIVSSTTTIKAIAAQAGFANSSVASGTFTINGAAATPVLSPVAGTYTSAQTVTITDSTPGSTIYYTTDGSTPTTSSTVYSGALTVPVTTTVKAIASAPAYSNSSVASALYTITAPSAAAVSISGSVKFSGTVGVQ